MRVKRKIVKVIFICLTIGVLLLPGIYASVSFNASGRTYDNVEDVPAHVYGLILGTSPYTVLGARNYYFENRIKSAIELYNAGKIQQIIVSGGNYTEENGYDEPRAMTDSLISHGVPFNSIIRDYDGTRTLRSIVKAKETYKIDSVIVISQKYHNERAIAQADKCGLKAIGYNAPHSHILRNRIKNILREFPARVKLCFDLLFGDNPTFEEEACEVAPNHLEEWYYEPMYKVPGHWTFCSNADSQYGVIKIISSDTPDLNGNLSYYNTRHGYYVKLPKGIGINQTGENIMGAHGNEFYNSDTTLIVSTSAMFYDILLDDHPNYTDTLKKVEKDFLTSMGEHTTHKVSPDMWITEGHITHFDSEEPWWDSYKKTDRYIRKWLLKKDIRDRECEISLTIYFNDSLKYRLPEFENIINQFPDLPSVE